MADHLGIKKFIWLARGLQPDPITDGHVDGICTFVKPGVVLLDTTADKKGRNYSICQDALKRLEAARDARGEKLKVIELPLTSEHLVHMNFYICNGGIIVPVSGKKSEDGKSLFDGTTLKGWNGDPKFWKAATLEALKAQLAALQQQIAALSQ